MSRENPNINAERIMGHLTLDGSTSTSPSLKIEVGVTPSVITNGDMWNNGTNIVTVINGTYSIISGGGGTNYGTFGITLDGSGSTITTGFKQYVIIPYDCDIDSWYLIGDLTGSCVMDVWKSNNIPTVSNTITGSQKPTISSQIKNSSSNLSTWTKSVTSGDVIGFNVDSISNFTKLTLTIKVIKT